MKCEVCGREIDDHIKFCKYCGALVKAPESGDYNEAAVIRCVSCGAAIKEGFSFCTQCGTPVTVDKNVQEFGHSNRSKSKKTGKIIIIFIVIIILLLAGFAAYYFTDKNGLHGRNKEKNPESSYNKKASEDEINPAEAEQESEIEEINADDSDDGDVVDIISKITNECNRIVETISLGNYDETMVQKGITAYSDSGNIAAVLADKNCDDYNYARSFYYVDNTLVYAEFIGIDSHQLYFDNHKLIRWRYCAEALDHKNAINYDRENTASYMQWERRALEDSDELMSQWENAGQDENGVKDYMLPGSDSRYVSQSELADFTAEECSIARNEIYARHGRKFKDEGLQNYFGQFDWYVPSIESEDFQESMLNEYEVANRDLIVAYEKEMGYR